MSKRKIERDYTVERQKRYQEINSDECMEAIWEALATLSDNGFSIGEKADSILSKREKIKSKLPKDKKSKD